MGTINDTYINNSGSLFNKIININMKNKSLTSLDIKSLYANVPVDKRIERLENHLKKTNTILFYASLNWLKSVPYARYIVISNTTLFMNRNLVYLWVLHLVVILHAFILNSLNLVLLNTLYPVILVTSVT